MSHFNAYNHQSFTILNLSTILSNNCRESFNISMIKCIASMALNGVP